MAPSQKRILSLFAIAKPVRCAIWLTNADILALPVSRHLSSWLQGPSWDICTELCGSRWHSLSQIGVTGATGYQHTEAQYWQVPVFSCM